MHVVRVLATNLALAALVIAAAALALAVDRFWPFALPAQLALLGWPLLLLGALPILAAEYCLLAFGHATGAPADAPRRLVTQGIYAWVRNPIYLGAAALLFGVAFLNSSPTLLLIAVAFLALIDTYVVRFEEPRLERRFGAGYLRYKQDAPRWLPRRTQRSGRDQPGRPQGDAGRPSNPAGPTEEQRTMQPDQHPGASMSDLPEHVRSNRALWDRLAGEYEQAGEAAWASQTPTWGIWGVPEADLGLLPADLAGRDAIELGCGTAYVSAWMARRGARVVGVDNSEAQLATARRLQRQHGIDFPLLHGNAEVVPYPDASFDFAISEYGACLWADPQRWVPEAARLLRPGGRLVFLVNSLLMILCAPEEEDAAATNQLLRPAFGLYRIEWPGESGVEFHLTHGDWIRLLRRSGLEIEDLIEVRPPDTATTRYPFVTLDWARQWPCEEVWKARKRP